MVTPQLQLGVKRTFSLFALLRCEPRQSLLLSQLQFIAFLAISFMVGK
jgi:hypothetical protein